MVRQESPGPGGGPDADVPGPTGGEDFPLPDLFHPAGTGRSLLVRVLAGAAGAILILAAVVVWVIPVLTGSIPLYLGGAMLLAMAHPKIARWLNRQERRLPRKVRLLLRPKLRRQMRAAERDAP